MHLNKGIGIKVIGAVNNLNHFSNSVQEKKFVFAGFNALNAAEEKSFNTLYC
jgi:hypothetical protein